MKQKIIVIGSMNYDIILKMERRPAQGETLPVKEAVYSAGGKGANQAVQSAKLGADTAMVGCVGSDSMGGYLIKTAEGYGLDCTHVRITEGQTGLGVDQVMDDGSVYGHIVLGANYALTKTDVDNALPLIRESGIMILQNEIPAEVNEYAIDQAKACGCLVLMNVAPAVPVKPEYLRKIDIFVANEVEAGYYCGKTIDSVEKAVEACGDMARELGNKCVFTLGSMGAVVSDGSRTEIVPPCKVKAIETVGAGDSSVGAIAYALTQGSDLFRACRFAARCSAITVQRMGAQPSMPTLQEVTEQFGSLEDA